MPKPGIDLKGFVFFSVLLLGFWFLMSPNFGIVNIVVGVLCTCGIIYYWRTDLYQVEKSMGFSLKQLVLLIKYMFHLAYNVILANISVAKIVLQRKMPLSPGFILVKTKLNHDMTKLIYANSITLTPGTITINLNDDRLLVHAITEDAACDVSNWYMQDKLKEIEEAR